MIKKYLGLPVHLLLFWYPESLVVWVRVWRNTIWYLEEDLAVGLMLKLIFVPLFHDSTIVGRALSFCFRAFRILIGLFAFAFSTILEIILASYWFLIPILSFLPVSLIFSLPSDIYWLLQSVANFSRVLLFSGAVLFGLHVLSHPEKKLWQIKDEKDLWQASFVKQDQLSFKSLIPTFGVKSLLTYLEISPDQFFELSDSVNIEDIAQKAWEIGKKLSLPYLGPEHFFVAKVLQTPQFEKFLIKIGLSSQDFEDCLDFLEKKRELNRLSWIWDDDFHIRHLKGVNRGWLGVPTPALDAVSRDLTRLASQESVEDCIGREASINQIISILSSSKEADVILVGEPGSGKSTLVGYLAKLIVLGDAPQTLATKRLVEIDFTKLLTGVKTQGDLAQKLSDIFDEIKFSQNIILFIDQIENLGLGEAGSEFNLYALMMPYIDSPDFQFIATTTPGSYTKVIEKNSTFARVFTKVELEEATTSETFSILEQKAIEAEWKRIKTTVSALKEIVKFSSLYVQDRVLPDSALNVFGQCLVKNVNGWVTKKVVEDVVSVNVKVPVGEIKDEKKDELLNLESVIHRKMIDQAQAVRAVSDALRRSAANLNDQNRPIGSFLFVGPTGVGKTELAKILAQVYFKGGGQFLRFDMSEYQSEESVAKLIGKTDEEGQMTEAVRRSPYSLLLLDEFEKANPKILTIFLQVLDDGRLTDGTGKTANFTNTIIIATSNAGSVTLAEGLKSGKGLDQLQAVIENELIRVFHPELINRFDEVVLFQPLSPNDLQKIVQLKLAELQKKLEEQGYLINFSQDLINQLATKGYDPVMGARPLRRLIQDTLEARLSVLILEGKLQKGQVYQGGMDLLV